MKKVKILLIVIAILFSTGCSYFEIQKENQQELEENLNYLNEKYSQEPGFEKYERKDIYDSGYSIFEGVLYDICGNNLGTGSGIYLHTMIMKDNTKVVLYKGSRYDDRQSEIIVSDFNQYLDNKLTGLDITNRDLKKLSSVLYTDRVDENVFDKYYSGNIEQFFKDSVIRLEGELIIWIDANELESKSNYLLNIFKELDIESYNYDIYIMDKAVKEKLNLEENIYKFKRDFTQEGLLSILTMRGERGVNDYESFKALKYVRVADDLGIALYEDYSLNIGDIIVQNSKVTAQELSDNIYNYCKAQSYRCVPLVREPIYEVNFSNKLKQYMQSNGQNYINAYIFGSDETAVFDLSLIDTCISNNKDCKKVLYEVNDEDDMVEIHEDSLIFRGSK